MPTATTTEMPKAKELNELLRHPIATLQERLETLETEAKERLHDVLATGNTRLMELDGALAKVSKDDWTVPNMKRHLDDLRVRAENLRDNAVKRAQVIPAEAVEKIVTGSRGPIQNLARSLAELAKKLEPAAAQKANGPKAAAPVVKTPRVEAKA
jgi:predicted  nucleic acid-binding Zn-ribbon protein